MPVRFGTPRFILRSMTPQDVSREFLVWQNDPELLAGQNLRQRKTTRATALKTIQRADNHRLFYILICASFAETPIGFYAIRTDPANQVAETTVVIGNRDYWGKKVVLETRAALLDFLFDEMDLHKVVGRPHARNLASIFNYQAQGYTCEGVLRDQLVSVEDGARLDQLEFGLLRDEWQAQKGKANP